MDGIVEAKAISVKDEAKDFFGNSCTTQPEKDELLVLPSGPWSKGCDYRKFGSADDAPQNIDVMKLYEEARPAVVYFQMKGLIEPGGKMPAGKEFNWGGSGFIIEAENGKSLIVTDNHVVEGTGMDSTVKVTESKVVLADGRVLDAKTVAADPSTDLALVEIDTGAATKDIKPIEVADKEISGGGVDLVSFGQPYTSKTIYTSQGPSERIAVRSDYNRVIKPLPGEDPNRKILHALLPVRTGFSGAAVLDKDGKAVGVVDIETSFFSSLATPISKQTIDDLKSKRK